MSLWGKFSTLMKATASGPVEQLVEVNSLRIFQQEIRDAESIIRVAKTQLAAVMAQCKQLSRHNLLLEQEIQKREQQALAALNQGEKRLAEELAELIAEDEIVLDQQKQQQAHLQKQQNQLKQELRFAVRSIQNHQRQLDLARANHNAHDAMGDLRGCSGGLGVSLKELDDSVARIQRQQAKRFDSQQALIEIEAELDGSNLNQRLIKAGLNTGNRDGAKVLQRLEMRLSDESD